ncbi:hypothetical protein RB596_004982 [Gaeumannomyces avenae]
MGQATSQPDTMASQATRMRRSNPKWHPVGVEILIFSSFSRLRSSGANLDVRRGREAQDEKAKRDECMLFSSAKDPEEDCKTTIQQYRSCMEGFGFKV